MAYLRQDQQLKRRAANVDENKQHPYIITKIQHGCHSAILSRFNSNICWVLQ